MEDLKAQASLVDSSYCSLVQYKLSYSTISLSSPNFRFVMISHQKLKKMMTLQEILKLKRFVRILISFFIGKFFL
jgi:hypothetical protein